VECNEANGALVLPNEFGNDSLVVTAEAIVKSAHQVRLRRLTSRSSSDHAPCLPLPRSGPRPGLTLDTVLAAQHKVQHPGSSCESLDGSMGVMKSPNPPPVQSWCLSVYMAGGPRNQGGPGLLVALAFR